MLNVEPSNLVFLKTYNTEFVEIIITFTDQNGRPLEIADKINLRLVINKQEMTQYSIEPKTRKYVKGYGFLLFARKYKKQILNKGQDAFKKEVQKHVNL